jgi:hypothetical protein
VVISDTLRALTGSNSRFDRFRTRRNRRLAVIAYVGVLLAFLIITGLIDENWLAAPLLAAYGVTTILLYSSTRGISESPAADLDEHQIGVRNAAHKASYLPGMMIAFAGGFAVSHFSHLDTAFEIGLFIAIWGTVTALPTMVVAWRLPSEFSDEE